MMGGGGKDKPRVSPVISAMVLAASSWVSAGPAPGADMILATDARYSVCRVWKAATTSTLAPSDALSQRRTWHDKHREVDRGNNKYMQAKGSCCC